MRTRLLARAGLLLAIGAIVAGCSTMKDTFGSWFGEKPARGPAQAAATGAGQVYYAAVEGLAMYAQPSNSSEVVTRLSQYEKVTRTRTERGYAFVRAEKSGAEGWVDNAMLVWRIPSVEKAAPGATPAAGSAPAGKAAETAAPAAPQPVHAAEGAPEPSAPAPAPTPAKPSPSMFDPF